MKGPVGQETRGGQTDFRAGTTGVSARGMPGNPGLYGISVLMVAFSLSNTIADPDLWGYLAFGRLFRETGTFPYRDVFTYLPVTTPWIYHEWLTGVLFYPVYKHAGLDGLLLLRYLLAGITGVAIYRTARLRGATGNQAVAGIGIAALGIFGIGFSPVRAQIFTYLFFVLFLHVLETARTRGGGKRLWLLPAMMLPWCNLHGGFLAGLGVIAFYILDGWAMRRPLLPYLLALSACAAVTLVNPYGIEYWRYLVDAVAMPRPEIPEWAPLFRTSKTGLSLPAVAYLLLIMGVSAALLLRSRQTDIPAISCLAATLFLGLLHARHIVFFLISASVFVPGLSGLRAARKPDLAGLLGKKGVSIVSLSALALLAAFALPRLHDSRPLTMKVPSVPDAEGKGMYYPVGAADHIRERGYSGNVLTLFEWGEYLLWTLHPQCRVALDGRYETVYPKRISESYFEFYNATGKWDELLNAYPPDMILVKSSSGVRALLDRSPAWKPDFEDKGSVLYVRYGFLERSGTQE